MTGKVMLERMPRAELSAFISGMIEGMAYARFRKDTLAAGRRVEDGMNCIRRWFYGDVSASTNALFDGFTQHSQHTAWVVLGAILKKECGE